MKTQVGFVYGRDGRFYTPAQSGEYWVNDMWECDKDGLVPDISENPCPAPVNTSGMKLIGESKHQYEYPEWNPNF